MRLPRGPGCPPHVEVCQGASNQPQNAGETEWALLVLFWQDSENRVYAQSPEKRGQACIHKAASCTKSHRNSLLPQKGHAIRRKLRDPPSDDISSSSSSEFIHSREEMSTVSNTHRFPGLCLGSFPPFPASFGPHPFYPFFFLLMQKHVQVVRGERAGLLHGQRESCMSRQFKQHLNILREFSACLAQP